MCYNTDMATISVRQLRNDVSDVLRRAEAGEELTVTVNGRPTARVVPLSARPSSIPWELLARALERGAADSALAEHLEEMLPDTTDDI
ncbi:MAG: hypothetical protein BMS9Abin20_0703 [Acidimicrobiia bacterium]|nr:MAG: hypothetical protein BMS9Abin20_0703 [Acidimicrobiia bacterium]